MQSLALRTASTHEVVVLVHVRPASTASDVLFECPKIIEGSIFWVHGCGILKNDSEDPERPISHTTHCIKGRSFFSGQNRPSGASQKSLKSKHWESIFNPLLKKSLNMVAVNL